MKRPSLARIVLVPLPLLIFVAALFVGPVPTGEGDLALRLMTTVVSIFGGMLIAVMTLLGDPKNLFGGTWRLASVHRRYISSNLGRLVALFRIYLTAILIGLSAVILDTYQVDLIPCEWVNWVKHISICLGGLALVWSFALPGKIYEVQMDRLKEEVERRRVAS